MHASKFSKFIGKYLLTVPAGLVTDPAIELTRRPWAADLVKINGWIANLQFAHRAGGTWGCRVLCTLL